MSERNVDVNALYAGVLPSKVGDILMDRNGSHGDPIANHDHIAELWTAHLGLEGGAVPDGKLNAPITGEEVAEMMMLLKLSRRRVGGHNVDHYADAIGYASIAALYVPDYDAEEAYLEAQAEADGDEDGDEAEEVGVVRAALQEAWARQCARDEARRSHR